MDYATLAAQTEEYLKTEQYFAAALSNISALLMCSLEDLNWAGFYIMRGGRLVVGPFQGKPACIHIAPGKGVCGTSAASDRTWRMRARIFRMKSMGSSSATSSRQPDAPARSQWAVTESSSSMTNR